MKITDNNHLQSVYVLQISQFNSYLLKYQVYYVIMSIFDQPQTIGSTKNWSCSELVDTFHIMNLIFMSPKIWNSVHRETWICTINPVSTVSFPVTFISILVCGITCSEIHASFVFFVSLIVKLFNHKRTQLVKPASKRTPLKRHEETEKWNEMKDE